MYLFFPLRQASLTEHEEQLQRNHWTLMIKENLRESALMLRGGRSITGLPRVACFGMAALLPASVPNDAPKKAKVSTSPYL